MPLPTSDQSLNAVARFLSYVVISYIYVIPRSKHVHSQEWQTFFYIVYLLKFVYEIRGYLLIGLKIKQELYVLNPSVFAGDVNKECIRLYILLIMLM